MSIGTNKCCQDALQQGHKLQNCQVCSAIVCPRCLSQCTECGKAPHCKHCANNLIPCSNDSCDSRLCATCYCHSCETCEQMLCNDCLDTQCNQCNSYVCSDCLLTCYTCDEWYCTECITWCSNCSGSVAKRACVCVRNATRNSVKIHTVWCLAAVRLLYAMRV